MALLPRPPTSPRIDSLYVPCYTEPEMDTLPLQTMLGSSSPPVGDGVSVSTIILLQREHRLTAMLSFLALLSTSRKNVDKTTFLTGFLLRQRFIRRLQKIQ